MKKFVFKIHLLKDDGICWILYENKEFKNYSNEKVSWRRWDTSRYYSLPFNLPEDRTQHNLQKAH